MPRDDDSPKATSEDVPRDAERDPLDDILEDETAGSRTNRVLRFARRMMDRRELAEDTKDLLYAVLSTSDKAKTEAVKMVAREVRTYLDELKLKEDLMHLATSYSLEVSLHLKPLDSTATARAHEASSGAPDAETEPESTPEPSEPDGQEE